MRVSRTLTEDELPKSGRDSSPASDMPDVPVGAVVSWDKQPRFLRDAPGKGGRSVAVVVPSESPAYVRLRQLSGPHWFDWSRESFVDRLRAGSITIEDPWALLELLQEHFALAGFDDATYTIGGLLATYRPAVASTNEPSP